MTYFRYWLSAQLIEWGVRMLPDEYTRSRMAMGMQWAADLINKELAIEDGYNGQMELGLGEDDDGVARERE